MMKSFKKRLKSNRWVIDSLAKLSILFSPWMRTGIIFFHQGRCGSSVVADLLGRHPKISSNGEIFNRYMKKKRLPTRFENMLRMRRALSFPDYAVVEVKYFGCQHLGLIGISINDFVDAAKQCGFRKFIILNRHNYLKQIVSSKVGLARGENGTLR
jgi:hypothetical protein